ncbi:MAG: endonuclease [Sphingomonas sp.]|nr:MAG: endonuclease [Sphingomonas sp.]
MPSKPPRVKARRATPAPWATSKRASRQARGYGREHDAMRARVLREEPLCRICDAAGRVTASTIADHITPKAEGGTNDRENYQGVCGPCHVVKTAQESARARRRI